MKDEDKKREIEKKEENRLRSGVGAYAPQSLYTLDLSRDRWEKEHKQNAGRLWRDSPEGRLAIRTFSRGVLGAVFFTWGARYAGRMMENYHPDHSPENWVQGLARTIDTIVGKPIEATVNLLGGDGRRAVTFRPTRTFYRGLKQGRTLGDEVIGVTGDFAAMSVGDAIGRDLAMLVDPNAEVSWKREDGSIDVPQAAKTLATNVFRYLTYNQGEDWAVAIPYVYYLRWQRNLLNRFSPGFSYDSDHGLNGGSFKVDTTSRIVGNYQLEGLLDLQGRFTAYNVGTLMFREAYTGLADKFLTWKQDGYPVPDMHLQNLSASQIADGAKDLARWAARDTIKGSMYMTPAVPYFWMTRTPQNKFRGLFVHPEYGPVTYRTPAKRSGYDLVHVNELNRSTNKRIPEEHQFKESTPTFFSRYDPETGWSEHPAPNPLREGRVNPYGRTFGTADSVLNAAGSFNNRIRKEMHKGVRFVEDLAGIPPNHSQWKARTDTYTNAALSYTPYFWAKTEFANLWDNARMDMAIERAIDGITGVNAGEFVAGLGEIWNTTRLRPLSDPKREAEAQEAIRTDVSAADIFDPKMFRVGYRSGGFVGTADPVYTTQARFQTPLDLIGVRMPGISSPNRHSFVERLNLHKRQANSRMEQFKRDTQPSSFVDTLAARQPAPQQPAAAPPTPRPATFAEQETVRAQPAASQDFPETGVTIH